MPTAGLSSVAAVSTLLPAQASISRIESMMPSTAAALASTKLRSPR